LLAQLGDAPWAVVTSGARKVARARLLAAALPIPKVLISSDDVHAGKPNPEGYPDGSTPVGAGPEALRGVRGRGGWGRCWARRRSHSHRSGRTPSRDLGAHFVVSDLGCEGRARRRRLLMPPPVALARADLPPIRAAHESGRCPGLLRRSRAGVGVSTRVRVRFRTQQQGSGSGLRAQGLRFRAQVQGSGLSVRNRFQDQSRNREQDRSRAQAVRLGG
jgi:hypothetical protein